MVDCIEDYACINGAITTVYRARVYSHYIGGMVPISGRKGLHTTAQAAITYAIKWLDSAL